MESVGRGRPKKFCSPSCKQRAYEARLQKRGGGLSARRRQAKEDRFFELRCAAEDVATAVEEGASATEIKALTSELVELARQIERQG